MVGAAFAGFVADKYGRRKGMFTGASVIVIGTVIACSSMHLAQLVIGRWVTTRL